MAQARQLSYSGIARVPEQTSYPLSSSQRRLWVLSQFEEGNAAYNVPGVYVFEGALDVAALEASFQALIKRHEILRTVFKDDEQGEVKQFIHLPEAAGFNLVYRDLRQEAAAESLTKELVHLLFIKPFDLVTGPLLHAAIYQVADNKWVFGYVMHHIISDGWSKGILINELLQLYNAQIRQAADPLTPLRIQYRDYATWEQEQLNGPTLAYHKKYWLHKFEGELPVLELPGDHARPAIKTYNGGVVSTTFNKTLTAGIQSLSTAEGSTLFMGLLAAVKVLLYRYTNQADLVVGSLIAGREHADLENQIGYYLNTLALRTQFNGTDHYKALLENVKAVTLGAYEHQVYPFEELVNDLQLQRDMSRNPLIDVMVVLQNTERRETGDNKGFEGLTIHGYEAAEQLVSKFDLLFSFIETTNGLQLDLEYNSDIYRKETIRQLCVHLENLLADIIARPALPIEQLNYLTDEEKQTLLVTFNDTDTPWPRDTTMMQLFRAQTQQTPHAIALEFETETVTYEQLDVRSDQLAAYLQHAGVTPDTLVPVCLERSPDMIIGILGILKAGGAYVPIDPAYPEDRIRYMLEDCNARIVVSSEHSKQKLPLVDGVEIISINGDNGMADMQANIALAGPAPHHLAYVIYTSGSTGKPKGVLVEHQGMLNHLFSKINELKIDAHTVLAYTAAYTFDISVWQMFAALLCGGRTIIYSSEMIYEPAALIQSIDEREVTILELVPSYLAAALREAGTATFKSLQYLLVTGEAVNKPLLAQWFEHPVYGAIPVVNAYGPTEASDDICHHIMRSTPPGINVPVGKPIQNMQVYVLGNSLQLCPVGVAGEICVAGVGISRGYLNQPALTDQKFVANPYSTGTNNRLYRTGDLGRWLPDGTIEYMGRFDDQVKIRGYRIELGEIETVLLEAVHVAQAVVLAMDTDTGDKRLVAYIVPADGFDRDTIITHLRSRLPEYMVPAILIELDKIPLTVNGKLDRKALPDPAGPEVVTATEYVAPRNEVEEKMVAIWQELLGREKIGIRDNFFELGGHSIRAVQLISRINVTFLVRISIHSIFRDPTIENIAGQIIFILDQDKQKQNKENLIRLDI
jgi:amino acid adenylation domain-containing protein